MNFSQEGLSRCIRFSHPPNSFHYCGPERQADVEGYATGAEPDGGLPEILSGFETLYSYLTFIAGENHIHDPFDVRVVSAYWLGNRLLFKARYRPLERHLADSLMLKSKLKPEEYRRLISTLDYGVPHHTFHVLNVFRRTGHASVPHTLQTMDACRISWGTVRDALPGKPSGGKKLIVMTRPLVFSGNVLTLGAPIAKPVKSVNGKGLPGDTVAIHWGYACDTITPKERDSLMYFTELSIQLANRSL